MDKVAKLVSEVSAASNEQAQGIEQVNTAVSQMDKVTQSNAANAEETASASEELSGQAVEMNQFVSTLSGIISGNGKDGGAYGNHGKVAARKSRVLPHRGTDSAPLAHAKRHVIASKNTKKNAVSDKVVEPSQVIPLDDDEMKDF